MCPLHAGNADVQQCRSSSIAGGNLAPCILSILLSLRFLFFFQLQYQCFMLPLMAPVSAVCLGTGAGFHWKTVRESSAVLEKKGETEEVETKNREMVCVPRHSRFKFNPFCAPWTSLIPRIDQTGDICMFWPSAGRSKRGEDYCFRPSIILFHHRRAFAVSLGLLASTSARNRGYSSSCV